jgi:hypothetical protein
MRKAYVKLPQAHPGERQIAPRSWFVSHSTKGSKTTFTCHACNSSAEVPHLSNIEVHLPNCWVAKQDLPHS